MDEIIERLARECAEGVASDVRSVAGEFHFRRDFVGDLVADAMRRLLASAPVPSPVSEARLKDLRDYWSDPIERDRGTANEEEALALLAHVAHLTRALHDCGLDGTAAVWAAGYEAGRAAGAREQRPLC